MSDYQPHWTFPWEDRTPSDYGIPVGPAMSGRFMCLHAINGTVTDQG